jgi:UPF0755 protein
MKRFLAFLIALAVIVGGAFLWERMNFDAAGPRAAGEAPETVVMVKPGVGLRGISQALAQSGVVESPDLFLWGVRLRGTGALLKAGEYAIPSRASMHDIMDILIAGRSLQHKITAAEGLTSDMIVRLINADPGLKGPPVAAPPEGTLLPETYLYRRGDTRQDIIDRMQNAQIELLSTLWPKRAPNLPFNSEADAITLASIVEKETSIPSERRHIAAIFVNRLRMGMLLQSDPTIIYSITRGYPLGRGIRRSELARVTPYNSYAVAGLPPTPICNPGRDAIAAVLDPGTTNDLYFVAAGNGGHVFSATIGEQERHVAELRTREKIQRTMKPQVPAPTVPHL